MFIGQLIYSKLKTRGDILDFLFYIALILIVVTFGSLAIWVYKDAKNIGFNPLQWALLSVLIPLFLGLLMYLAKRKKERNVICKSCKEKTSLKQMECEHCHSKIDSFEEIPQGNARIYLLVFLATFICWFIFIMILGLS